MSASKVSHRSVEHDTQISGAVFKTVRAVVDPPSRKIT